MINVLRENFTLNRKSRVLDLGSGTGQIALKLAPHVSEVIAIDPQEEMLQEGKRLAAARRLANIRWLSGDSAALSSMAVQIGDIDCTVIARAFHWMNREQTLRDLYKIIRKDGGIAVIVDSGPLDDPEIRWKEVTIQTVKLWLGKQRKAGTSGTYTHPLKRHHEILSESDFHGLKSVSINIERTWTVERIIGYLYSTSYTSLPVLGDKREPFEADLRKKLTGLEPTGRFKESVKVNIIMVWKSLPATRKPY